MKRYLISGFLTILIVTLNFTFLIVLLTEDAHINYKTLSVLWGVVILAAAGLAYLQSDKKTSAPTEVAKVSPKEEDPSLPKEFLGNSAIYDHKEVKSFKIDLSQREEGVQAGFFWGYIKTERSLGGKVQAVYDHHDQLVGHIAENQDLLSHNLEQLYREPMICWGHLSWIDPNRSFSAEGFVPILFSQPELNRIRKIARLKAQLLEMEDAPGGPDIAAYEKKATEFSNLEAPEKYFTYLYFSPHPDVLKDSTSRKKQNI